MNEPIVLSSTTCYVLYNEFSGYLLGVSTNCLHVSASYTPRVIQYTKREYALDIIYQNPELLNGFEVRTVVEQTIVTVKEETHECVSM